MGTALLRSDHERSLLRGGAVLEESVGELLAVV